MREKDRGKAQMNILAKLFPFQKYPIKEMFTSKQKSNHLLSDQLCRTDSTFMSELASPESADTATLITGSLNTDSSVLVVVRLVRDVRGGGMML